MRVSPNMLLAVVNDSVPVVTSIRGCTVKKSRRSAVTLNASPLCCVRSSSGGPAAIDVAHPRYSYGPWFWWIDRSGPEVNSGGWFTNVIVSASAAGSDVSEPPFSLPPSSCSVTRSATAPYTSGISVKLRYPAAFTEGATANHSGRSAVTRNVSRCDASAVSPLGPAATSVAHSR